MSIGASSRIRSRPVMGSVWIFPPPVALPDVFGTGGQPGGGLVSQFAKSTLLSGSMILSPVPKGLFEFEGIGRPSMGGRLQRVMEKPFGALRAIDPATGELRWEFRYDSPTLAGVMSTASGLVFAGNNEGDFMAFNA